MLLERHVQARVAGAYCAIISGKSSSACPSTRCSAFSTGEWAGHLDILVNCAAADYTDAVEEISVAQWDQELAVNLRGPFLFARAAFPWMKKQGRGHIVNLASTASVRAWANAAPYHVSKWGLLGFSRGLSVEGRPYGIRVTTIIPGDLQTTSLIAL